MQLKFPHARLTVYQCLTGESASDCYSSIINAAHQLGMVKFADSSIIRTDSASSCGSTRAAKMVLEQILKERVDATGEQTPADLADQLMAQVEHNLRGYQLKTGAAGICTQGPCATKCGQLAPIIMDLVLQALTPYA